jgi:hypothetical protein
VCVCVVCFLSIWYHAFCLLWMVLACGPLCMSVCTCSAGSSDCLLVCVPVCGFLDSYLLKCNVEQQSITAASGLCLAGSSHWLLVGCACVPLFGPLILSAVLSSKVSQQPVACVGSTGKMLARPRLREKDSQERGWCLSAWKDMLQPQQGCGVCWAISSLCAVCADFVCMAISDKHCLVPPYTS